eukprot:scaffold169679_cov14-Tisochrysis_lutea.AAC.1
MGANTGNPLPPPEELDPGSTSVSRCAQGGTVRYAMQNPLSLNFRGPQAEVLIGMNITILNAQKPD